jgi:acyl dehydratase
VSKGRILTPGRYGFHDVAIGDEIDLGSAEISADLIDRFAEVSGDRYVLHMNRDEARARGFPDRVAHGLLVLSVVDGLKNNAPACLEGLASLGWQWRFERPVLAGDVIHAGLRIDGKRVTGSGRRGILRLGFKVANQRGDMVQSGQNELIFDL